MQADLMSKLLSAALPAMLIVGCAYSPAQQAANAMPGINMRVIVTFNFTPPIGADAQLNALLSATCDCQPQFIRPYLGNASIYQITLPQDQSFASFASKVTARGAALGIRSVEQDRMQHH